MENERDIVDFTDEEGNPVQLEVLDYFFHNGQEYALLGDVDQDCGGGCEGCHAHDEDSDHEHEHNVYIMKVMSIPGETEDDEMEEFVPVEESLMDELISIVQTRFSQDEDDEYEDDEDENDD